MTDVKCVFCDLPKERIVARNDLASAIRDNYPVSRGHTLVVPRRHVATWFEASREERIAILDLIDGCKAALDEELNPSGYNVGFNSGIAAGQTIMHLHVHLIPRFTGDVDDPTGGVRLVIPEKGNYRRKGRIPRSPGSSARSAAMSEGGSGDPFEGHLDPLWAQADRIDILSAFVQRAGVDHIAGHLSSAIVRGARIRILTGDYLHLTQARALRNLLALEQSERLRGNDGCLESHDVAQRREGADLEREECEIDSAGRLEVRVIEVDRLGAFGASFHPKAWIFIGHEAETAFVGSSNLTRTALTDGIEWNLRIDSDRDPEGFARVCEAYDTCWAQGRAIDSAWLEDYAALARQTQWSLPPGEADEEVVAEIEPRDVQVEALEALEHCREQGYQRALVVMATGLGKTMLSVMDI